MRVKRQTLQPSARSEEAADLRPSPAAARQPIASPALALQARLQIHLAKPAIEHRLPVGQRALIIVLLASASWGLVGGLVVAIVR